MKDHRFTRIEVQPALIGKVPNIGFVLCEKGGGEEEEQNDLEIGRFDDWAMWRFGDVRRDIRYSIVDCRLPIFLGFHHLIIFE